jgi:hypothetical protein
VFTLLVEFFGLPGVGKSSMSRHVADTLLAKGFTVDEITYDIDHRHLRPARFALKCGHAARFATAHPSQAISVCKRMAATQQASQSDLGKEALNWLFVAGLASRRRSEGMITVLDQGVAQALWSVGHAARNPLWLDLLSDEAQKIPLDLVIFVRASVSTVRDRLLKRDPPVSRLERGLETGNAPLLRAEMNCDAVIRTLKGCGVPIVEVTNDNLDEMALSSRLVSNTICSMLRARALPSDGNAQIDAA